MPIDYRKNAAMRHRALMMTVDMDEPMGGYPKSKAPELVVEPVVAMPEPAPRQRGGWPKGKPRKAQPA